MARKDKDALTLINKAMVKFAKARSEVYCHYPRLYDTMDLCHVHMTDKIPTLGVQPKRNGEYNFYWNPEFVNNELTDTMCQGVIKHELLHIVMEHTTTRLPHFDFNIFDEKNSKKIKADDVLKQRIWNMATDMAINQFIRKDLIPEDGKDAKGLFPEMFGLEPWYNAEYYYRELAKKVTVQQVAGAQGQLMDNHTDWGDAEGDGEGDQQGEGQEDKNSKDQKKSQAGHGGASEKDPTAGKGQEKKASGLKGLDEQEENKGKDNQAKQDADAEDKEANGQKVKDIAEDLGIDKFNEESDKAAKEVNEGRGGKDAGKYGGTGAEILIMDFGAGQKATPGWMRKTKHEAIHGFDIIIEQTRKRPNRRFGNLFPGKRRQDVGNRCLIAVDISGSISDPLYKEFTQHVNKFTRFSDFDIVFFNDYLVDEHGKVLYSAYDKGSDPRKAIRKFKLNQKQALGGGTNFEPIMLLWNKVCNQYDGLFIFTDGCASYSTPPRQPRCVNWIVYSDDRALNHLKHGHVFNMVHERYSREMPRMR